MAELLYANYKVNVDVEPRTGASDDVTFEAKNLPISQFECTFVLNAIPTARFMLTPGQEIGSDDISKVQALIGSASRELQITATLTAVGDIDVEKQWPADKLIIWRGYIDSVTMSIVNGQQVFEIVSSHWLARLDEGTVASKDVAPSRHTSIISYISGISGLNSASGVSGQFNEDNKVIWDNLLLPAFNNYLNIDTANTVTDRSFAINTVQRLVDLGAVSQEQVDWVKSLTTGNSEAYDILAGGDEYTFNSSQDINIADTTFRSLEALVSPVEAMVDRIMGANRGQQSAWSKLQQLASVFRLAVIPTIKSATLAPYAPVFVDADTFIDFYPDMYMLVASRAQVTERYAGAAIYGREVGRISSLNGSDTDTLAGVWIAPQARGHLYVDQAPAWLQLAPDKKLAADKLRRGAPGGDDTAVIQDSDIDATLITGSRYARSVWQDVAFKGRSVNINTPLRLDVCPGTYVKLNGLNFIGENKKGTALDYDRSMYGYVMGVTIRISPAQATAISQYSLSHIRSDAESDIIEAGGGDIGNPLYASVWNGSELLKHD